MKLKLFSWKMHDSRKHEIVVATSKEEVLKILEDTWRGPFYKESIIINEYENDVIVTIDLSSVKKA